MEIISPNPNEIVIQLTGDKSLVINVDDYKKVIEHFKSSLIVEMAVKKPELVYWQRDIADEKISALMKMLKEQKMSDETREKYLITILELSKHTNSPVYKKLSDILKE